MSIGIPDASALRALAREHGFELSDEEAEVYRTLMAGSLATVDALEAAPSALPPVPADRKWWEPTAAENPHGAWYVRCEIRTRDDGPLAGMRFAAKDNVQVAGLPLLNGSALLEGYTAEVDATIVTRLLDAGATLLGKAHCENLCLSAGSHTNARGPVHNPLRRGRTSGGSSSGSAALLAAGEVELAIGGDQGGSIRVPAAYCGLVGMKPTFGLVPYTGIGSIDPHLDHTGPMTRTVRDNARMLGVIAGPDGIDARQAGLPAADYEAALERGARGLRVAVLAEGFTAPGAEDAVLDTVREAAGKLASLGIATSEVSVPEHAQANALVLPLLVQGLYRTVLTDGGQGVGRSDLYLPDLAARMGRWREHGDALSPILKLMTLAGATLERQAGSRPYQLASNQARRVRRAYDRALERADALLLPTAPNVAPSIPSPDAGILEQFVAASAGTANTMPFDATHHPAISVPCGAVDGLPVGMMLVGRHGDESTLYRIAYAFEQGQAA